MSQQWWAELAFMAALVIPFAVPAGAADHAFAPCAVGPRPECWEAYMRSEPFVAGRAFPFRQTVGFAPSHFGPAGPAPATRGGLDGRGGAVDDAINADASGLAVSEPAGQSAPEVASLDVPDEATIRQLIGTDPTALGSLSIGSPDGGALFGGVRLPESSLWHERNMRDAWGTTETLDYLRTAIEAVAREYPGSPSLCIGDLSHRAGGPIDRHRSHESGRDVDVGWYFVTGESQDFRLATARSLDLPRCWALVRAFVTQTDVEHIFMDRSVQRILFEYALENGADRGWLERVFAFPGGRRDTIVQHVRGHRNHLHVRFYNPRAQAWGRVAYPVLAEAGLVPPPVVYCRARRGDTLSTIAQRYGARVSAIRAANGLRSNLIRAGRRYRVPVRHLAAVVATPPLVVPPRLLPPPQPRSPLPLSRPAALLAP
jgi:murein endopeptidase